MRAYLLVATAVAWAGLVAACQGESAGDPGGAGGRLEATSTGTSSTSAAASTSSSTTTSASASTSASATTTTTTGSGGDEDPCAGAQDGKHCGADLGGLADHASLYDCAGGVSASATPCPNGCEGGACKEIAQDPCASAASGDGLYCGGSLAGGDAASLYDCQGGVTASVQGCPAGCQVNPPGVADACKPEGDPCAGASSGDGAYCGASLGGGDPGTLYQCVGGATSSSQACSAGCMVNPPGVADACNPVGGGACCVGKPAGVLTQSYSACGNGGSHYGVDLGTPIGTPIYAALSGTVVGSALGFPNCYDNGCSPACWNAFNYVKLKSDCGDPADASKDFYVYYLHIDGLAPGIANGAHVDQGQLVAYAGNSGCSSGPHIHLETVSVQPGGAATLNTCNSVDPASRYCN